MNIDTGEIRNKEDIPAQEFLGKWIEVDENQMTEKQKKNMQVSKHDNKSPLGKKRVAAKKAKQEFECRQSKRLEEREKFKVIFPKKSHKRVQFGSRSKYNPVEEDKKHEKV